MMIDQEKERERLKLDLLLYGNAYMRRDGTRLHPLLAVAAIEAAAAHHRPPTPIETAPRCRRCAGPFAPHPEYPNVTLCPSCEIITYGDLTDEFADQMETERDPGPPPDPEE
ncbi:MAG: hypothetical protein ACYS5V_14485 [Planctomycetota bacterium]|jgi:hypothetical protein